MTPQTADELRLVPSHALLAEHAPVLVESFSRALADTSSAAAILDLRGVTDVDSIGVNVIIGVFRECQARGLTFSVEVDDPHVAKLFRLLTLDRHFPVRTLA